MWFLHHDTQWQSCEQLNKRAELTLFLTTLDSWCIVSFQLTFVEGVKETAMKEDFLGYQIKLPKIWPSQKNVNSGFTCANEKVSVRGDGDRW